VQLSQRMFSGNISILVRTVFFFQHTRTILLACLFTGGVFGMALAEYSESLSSFPGSTQTGAGVVSLFLSCFQSGLPAKQKCSVSLFPALFGDFFSRPSGPSVGPFVHELIANSEECLQPLTSLCMPMRRCGFRGPQIVCPWSSASSIEGVLFRWDLGWGRRYGSMIDLVSLEVTG